MFQAIRLVQLTERDEVFRAATQAFVAREVSSLPAPVRARSWMGFDRSFSRRLGEAGLIGLSYPKRFGGQECGPLARLVVIEELLSAGAPVAAHWIAERQSGPLILRYGTEQQQQKHIPAIVRGEQCFCIGMSEPNSGSDLASIRTAAKRASGGGWRLGGQKIWTTHAHNADYMIALVRTSGTSADRQNGLSQFLIDLKAPGVTVRPITDLSGDDHFSEVFFDDVQLPDESLIGKEGGGWAQVNAELTLERSGPERVFSSMILLDSWITHLQAIGRQDDATLEVMGRLLAEFAALRAFSISVTSCVAQGGDPIVEASLLKDIGTSFEQTIPRVIGDQLASHPEDPLDPALLATLMYLTQVSPAYSLRGGTREVLRGIIARGLGLR